MVQPPTVFDASSPARQVLERLADRWTSMLVCALAAGPKRYGELRRQLGGVSAKMLTQTLRSLERDGLLTRHDHQTVPPHVEYALTDLGRTLLEPLAAMCAWNERHGHNVTTARNQHDHTD